MNTGACRTRGEGGGDAGTAGEPSEVAGQENDFFPPSRAGDPSAPHDTAVKAGSRSGGINPEGGSSNTVVLPEEAPPTEATGEPHPQVEQPAAAPGQGTVPAGLLWSDFGGAREAGDADAEETASREFAEESFGIFHGVRLESDSVARSQVGFSGESILGEVESGVRRWLMRSCVVCIWFVWGGSFDNNSRMHMGRYSSAEGSRPFV